LSSRNLITFKGCSKGCWKVENSLIEQKFTDKLIGLMVYDGFNLNRKEFEKLKSVERVLE